ncbi:hypothetical protein BG004_002783 [Podila humilis]|nr:hypothetical protein BG004_002783 [Podila humilis]
MTAETISTHTVKNDATTTIVTRTTTIVSEHQEIHAEPAEHDQSTGVARGVRKTLRDYWFPSQTQHNNDRDDDPDDDDITRPDQDPSLLPGNSVTRRAYDYWKSLTQDATEIAKNRVIEAKRARDEARREARWAYFGFKREAREALEKAEAKYYEALAAAEKAYSEAHEKAKSKWFQAVDKTEQEVGQIADQADDITHRKWDRFKAAVNSLAFNPPKYGCSPSSQYWFSRMNPAADSGWDCREIWDHSSRDDHRHHMLKNLPKKNISVDRLHDTFTQLYTQAAQKAKSAPSSTSFDVILKPIKDHYHSLLHRVSRNEQEAVDDLDQLAEKLKAKLNEAKYYEEQTDAWLAAQWNTVIDNAGDAKKQYEKVFRSTLKAIERARNEIYSNLEINLQRSISQARSNIHEAIKDTKDQADKSRVHHAVQDAMDSFSHVLIDAEAKINAAPKNAYQHAIETFNKDTALLKDKLQHAAKQASRSASSVAHDASKTGSSVSHKASKSGASISDHASRSVSSLAHKASASGSSLSRQASKSASSAAHQITHDAKSFVHDAGERIDDAKDAANSMYESATASVSSKWTQATPLAPLYKAQESAHRLLIGAKDTWFTEPMQGDANTSSIYAAVLAVYMVHVAYKLWLRRNLTRMRDPGAKSYSVVSPGDKLEQEMGRPDVEEITPLKSASRNPFLTVLAQFLSVVPSTLLLLAFLEISGFSRMALHGLALCLLTAQILAGDWLSEIVGRPGMVPGINTNVGAFLSVLIFAVALTANLVNWYA